VAYSLDATHTVAKDREGTPLRDGEGNVEHVDARAAVRHDGVVFGGVLEVHEGGKNYTGELCAHIDAAEDAARGLIGAEETAVRAAYVFDATSPVRAETKFRSKHDRSKQGYFASHLLDTMGLVRDRTDVALQLWQTSHVGSPTNVWADVEAARFAGDGERLPVQVLRCTPSHFSMRPNRTCRAWQRSARELAGRQVAARLRARSTHTVVADD
jgi:hypothetical protein